MAKTHSFAEEALGQQRYDRFRREADSHPACRLGLFTTQSRPNGTLPRSRFDLLYFGPFPEQK
jgi:hypothetical protein